ncbi:MAG: hypothetical protein IJ838_05975 [Paludibacteraceae bacterium]|nr:hypothetical protein [Paludibacteraceae bacterium]
MSRNIDTPAPKTSYICTLMLTHGCNLNCVYCFEKHKNPRNRMSLETAQRIVTLQNAKSMPTIGCSFCGMGCSDIVGG